jgi:hypothetical protein
MIGRFRVFTLWSFRTDFEFVSDFEFREDYIRPSTAFYQLGWNFQCGHGTFLSGIKPEEAV